MKTKGSTFRTKPIKEWTKSDYLAWQVDMGIRLREKIKEVYGYRKEHEFCKRVGIPQGTLSEILGGRYTPSAKTLLRIGAYSTIDAHDILWGFR